MFVQVKLAQHYNMLSCMMDLLILAQTCQIDIRKTLFVEVEMEGGCRSK